MELAAAKQEYRSQYYRSVWRLKKLYSLSLENSAYFYENYKDHFNTYYTEALDTLLKTSSTQFTNACYVFFDRYGTHIVTGAIYGGELKGYYSVCSKEVEFTSALVEQFKSGVNLAFNNYASYNGKMAYQLNNIASNVKSGITARSTFDVKGGSENTQSMLAGGRGTSDWEKSINESNAVIVDFTYNGLQPIWETIPSAYSSLKSKMKTTFEAYVKKYSNNKLSGLKEQELINSYDYTFPTYQVRTTAARIKDDPTRWGNPHDTVYFKNICSLNVLKTYGYNSVKLDFTYQARYIDDATYRDIFLYQAEEDVPSNQLLKTWGVGDRMGKSFTNLADSYENNIAKFPNDMFVLRYRAYGAWSDDWEIQNIKVSVTASKKTI